MKKYTSFEDAVKPFRSRYKVKSQVRKRKHIRFRCCEENCAKRLVRCDRIAFGSQALRIAYENGIFQDKRSRSGVKCQRESDYFFPLTGLPDTIGLCFVQLQLQVRLVLLPWYSCGVREGGVDIVSFTSRLWDCLYCL